MSPAPSRALLRLALWSVAAGVGTAVISALFRLGWVPPTLANPLIVLAFAAAAVRGRERALVALLAVALASALVELAIADPAFVQRDVLHYDAGGPFVVDSPLYMPISWVYIVVQMGVIALWLTERFGLGRASLIMAVTGGLNGPTYEFLAQYANWWTYTNCWLVAGVPVFVIASEAAIGASLPLVASQALRRSLPAAGAIGGLLGVFMWASAELAFAWIGPA